MANRNHFPGSMRELIASLLGGLMLLSMVATAQAQPSKPSAALKEINKLADAIERDQFEGRIKSQQEEEARLESLIQTAAQRATLFRIADWKGDELYALASLYQQGEKFDLAAQAWQEFLKGTSKAEKRLNAMASQVRSLIEIEKLDEAVTVLETLERSTPLYQRGYDALTVSRIALHKNLAEAYRDRAQYEKAARQARAGYNAMRQLGPRDEMAPLNRDARDYDQAALASIAIVSLSRLGKDKEAAEFKSQVERFDLGSKQRLLAIFQSELTAANLINNPSPGIKFSRWLNGTPFKPEELKGKVLLLHFWAMWSAPSAEAFSHLRDLQNKFTSRGGQVIGMTRFYGRSDKQDDLKTDQELKSLEEFLKRYNVSYPVAVAREDDLTNEDRFSVYSLPTIILIDRKGNVRAIRRGTGNWRALEKQVTRLLDEPGQ